jgi:hypothetical protein
MRVSFCRTALATRCFELSLHNRPRLIRHNDSAWFSRNANVVFPVNANRWDEKAGLRRDALSSQVIDAL